MAVSKRQHVRYLYQELIYNYYIFVSVNNAENAFCGTAFSVFIRNASVNMYYIFYLKVKISNYKSISRLPIENTFSYENITITNVIKVKVTRVNVCLQKH